MNSPFKEEHSRSNACGVTLMNNQNGYIVAHTMRDKPHVKVHEYPSMIRVDAEGSMEFDFDELTEEIGEYFDHSDFEEIMSTHYGRMVVLDDRVMFFANPEDAAEYIGFDLEPVQ
jgi:propane monooxygenase coupling protein